MRVSAWELTKLALSCLIYHFAWSLVAAVHLHLRGQSPGRQQEQPKDSAKGGDYIPSMERGEPRKAPPPRALQRGQRATKCAASGKYGANFWKAPSVGVPGQNGVFRLDASWSGSGEERVVEEAQRRYPTIPFAYLHENMDKGWRGGPDCAPFPCLYNLLVDNEVWQQVVYPGGEIYLYSAYLDVRPVESVIRILAAATNDNDEEPLEEIPLFCQIWSEGLTAPVVTRAAVPAPLGWSELDDGRDSGPVPTSYLVTCPAADDKANGSTATPVMVSLVTSPCLAATNALRVRFPGGGRRREKKGLVAVCVKSLESPLSDLSVRLAEWLEVVRSLGAERVFLYHLNLHPNTTKLLRHYQDTGFVDLTSLPLPGRQPNSWLHQHLFIANRVKTHIYHEKTSQHDCFYRNLYRYRYVAVLDVDEVVAPAGGAAGGWPGLVAAVESRQAGRFAAISFRHAYVFDPDGEDTIVSTDGVGGDQVDLGDVPREFHILTKTVRSRYPLADQTKSFLRTDQVVQLTSHRAKTCLPRGGPCRNLLLPAARGLLFHYRQECVRDISPAQCRGLRRFAVDDRSLLAAGRKEAVLAEAMRVLDGLGFVK